jgi:hypothetical protein
VEAVIRARTALQEVVNGLRDYGDPFTQVSGSISENS